MDVDLTRFEPAVTFRSIALNITRRCFWSESERTGHSPSVCQLVAQRRSPSGLSSNARRSAARTAALRQQIPMGLRHGGSTARLPAR